MSAGEGPAPTISHREARGSGPLEADMLHPIPCTALALLALSAAARPQEAPPRFVENAGQWRGPAHLRVGHGSVNGWLLEGGFVIDLRRGARGCAVEFALEGARPVAPLGERELPARRHFLGRRTVSARAFAAARYVEPWPGVDLVLREGAGLFEYDLELAPGAALEGLALRVHGARGLELAADGALVVHTALGELRQSAPVAWTVDAAGARRPVECAFRLLDEARFGFAAPRRALGEALVVDPGLEWGSYLGDYESDVVLDVAVAPNGEPVVVGTTTSPSYPATRDAYDLTLDGPSDAFVARFTADGADLVFATYLGGTGGEIAYAVALDGDQVLVAGETRSSDFPTPPGAYDATLDGSSDVFVARLSADGEQLLASTYLGGAGDERATGLAFDAASGVTLCGATSSPSFPATPGAFDLSYGGAGDAFVARLAPDLASLSAATFLGAEGIDVAWDVALDAAGGALVAGGTSSISFPTTPGAFDTSPSGVSQDGFVTRLTPSLGALVYSSFLGGVENDAVYGLAARADGGAVLVGGTRSDDFPTTPGALDGTHDGEEDGFLAVLSPDGGALELSTYLGGADIDRANAVALTAAGAMVVAGGTRSPEFPVTPWGVDTSFNSTPGNFEGDAFVLELGPAGALEYGTFIGGRGDDEANGLALLPDGRAIVAGRTSSHDFPTPHGFDPTYDFSGLPDGFVACLERSRYPFSYGDPGPSSLGYAPYVGAGFPSLAAGSHELWIDLGPLNTPGWLFRGTAQAAIPFAGGTLLVAPPLTRVAPVSLDYFGADTVQIAIDPSMVGATRYYQFWFVDAGAPTGVGFSPGVEVRYHP